MEILARLIHARRGTRLPQVEDIVYEFPLHEWHDVAGSKSQALGFCQGLLWAGDDLLALFSLSPALTLVAHSSCTLLLIGLMLFLLIVPMHGIIVYGTAPYIALGIYR